MDDGASKDDDASINGRMQVPETEEEVEEFDDPDVPSRCRGLLCRLACVFVCTVSVLNLIRGWRSVSRGRCPVSALRRSSFLATE